MGFKIQKKLGKALNHKTAATKKTLTHAVSLKALAAFPGELLPSLQLVKQPISWFKSLPKRARKSEQAQVTRVAKSLKQYGQVPPVITTADGRIVDGHIVVQALKSLGASEAWCVVIDHLSEDELNALHIALNRIGETGDWDLEALGSLLVELEELEIDLETTGFTLPELEILMTPPGEDNEGDGAEDIKPPTEPVSKLGDVWILDRHRLLCGDATDPQAYAILLEGKTVHVVSTDSPWNLKIDGFVSGLGAVKHGDFKMGAGEMSDEEFIAFCQAFHKLAAACLDEGGVFFSYIDWRSIDVIMHAGRDAGLRHINTAVWNKSTGGMGSLYRSAYELVVVFCKGAKLAVNNVELGKHGRDRTNVWTYPGANRRGSSAAEALAHHPTPKNVTMVADSLMDVSKRGARVLDPFMGSGTTILAAERTKRSAYGIELDPAYVDVAVLRWEAETGKQAIHAATGLTFAQVAAGETHDDAAQAAA